MSSRRTSRLRRRKPKRPRRSPTDSRTTTRGKESTRPPAQPSVGGSRLSLAQTRAQGLEKVPGDLRILVDHPLEVLVGDRHHRQGLERGDGGGSWSTVDHADLAEVVTRAEGAQLTTVLADRRRP